MDWIESLTLGLVQGLTEFLPVSSDGHLNITQHAFEILTGRVSSSASKIFFDVMLHVGTLAAILLHYRKDGVEAASGLAGSAEVSPAYQRPSVIRTALLVFVATLPLVPDKLFFLKWIEQAFQSLTATGVGFLITAAILAVNLRLKGGEKGPERTTYLDALLIGVAQMFAPLPGVSRSGLTITTALALGFSRTWAVGFSLMMAIPAICGAAFFEVVKLYKSRDPVATASQVPQIVAAAAVAGVVGYLAIAWLVRLVRSGRMWYFSVYLVLLGTSLIVLDAMRKEPVGADPSHSNPPAADRPAGPTGVDAGPRPVEARPQ